ncbi:protein cutoff [Drosophila biarmipes]|uniref:protein cutoff n=1 Tax=Drosophila biarmipes TaxID=125945 RepID=UPI0007E6AA9E|nr:protein cutoff [Drosophila biarmipes]
MGKRRSPNSSAMGSNYIVLNIDAHSWTEEDVLHFPTISKPISHGGFTMSPTGHFERNAQRMRFIVVPPKHRFPISLRDSEPEKPEKVPQIHLDNMLQFIESTRFAFLKQTNNMRVELNAQIVCTSEVLELMMCAPYEHKTGWSLGVSRYRNTMYICRMASERAGAFDQDYLRKMKESFLRQLHKLCVFENVVEPRTGQAYQEPGRFHGVFSLELNGNRVLFDSPVLAEQNPNAFNGPAHNWAELQMRLVRMNRQDWQVHNRTEALKWWAKCFLLGIESLYIAQRDDNSFVLSIQKTSVRDLWKDCEKDWSTGVCANFMVRLLGCMSQVMAPIDCPSTVYLFKFDAARGKVAYAAYPGRNQYTFVADWYRMMLDEHSEDLVLKKRETQTKPM